jgi:hypothetical protein
MKSDSFNYAQADSVTTTCLHSWLIDFCDSPVYTQYS